MSDITMEKRLQLVKQIRSRYNKDQYDLSNRERILYGQTSIRTPDTLSVPDDGEAAPEESFSSFRIRLVVAILLLAAVIAMDVNGVKVAGVAAEEIFQAISADYEELIDQWLETGQR